MTTTPHNPPEPIGDPVRETLNEVWRDAYEPDAAMAFDDFRCCARIKSLADDRKCWMSNAKALQKELNKLEGKVNELETNDLEKPKGLDDVWKDTSLFEPSPPYDPDKVFAAFVVGGSIILAAVGLAVAIFMHS